MLYYRVDDYCNTSAVLIVTLLFELKGCFVNKCFPQRKFQYSCHRLGATLLVVYLTGWSHF